MDHNLINVMGVHVTATNLDDALAELRTWIESGTRSYVCVTGVHGVIESQTNPRLRAIHNRAGLVVPDGMPLVYVGRLGGHRRMWRVCGRDLMTGLWKESVRAGYRHYFYGTTPETLDKLLSRVQQQYPGIQIAGAYAPPFRALTGEESVELVRRINASAPDVIWVGLSTPKQELWMSEFRGALDAPVMVGVGAAFDFHAGTLKEAPQWMQPLCLEWLFRLAVEPRRLWRRYLRSNPRFLAGVFLQFTGLRRYEAL